MFILQCIACLSQEEYKIKLYNTYLRPTIIYEWETWSTTKNNQGEPSRFKRNNLWTYTKPQLLGYFFNPSMRVWTEKTQTLEDY